MFASINIDSVLSNYYKDIKLEIVQSCGLLIYGRYRWVDDKLLGTDES